MDDLTFYKGWALLTAQPYAAFLAYDDVKMQLQEGMFKRATASYDGQLWLRVVEHWIMHETEWPKLPEILALLKSKLPAKTYQLTAPPAPEGYLPRQIYQREGKLAGLTIHEAAIALIPEWLKTAQKGDPDYQRAQDFLRRAQEARKNQTETGVGREMTCEGMSRIGSEWDRGL